MGFHDLLLFQIIFLLIWEFFTPPSDDGFPLESKWQQVSSKSPGLFLVFWAILKQCCHLDGLFSSSYFQVLHSLYQSFGDWTKHTNCNWYHSLFHVPKVFSVLELSLLLLLLFLWVFSLVSLFNGISTFMGYLIPKSYM